MEMFRNDFGQYPYSIADQMQKSAPAGQSYDVDNQVNTPTNDVGSIPCNFAQGAHLLTDAMTGRDTLGYDPSTTNASKSKVRWNNNNPRTGPYVKLDARSSDTVFTDSLDNRLGEITFESAISGQPTTPKPLRFIVDGFGSPILYYRANPNSRPNQPAHQIYGVYDPTVGGGMASAWDNKVFTSDTAAAGSGYRPGGIGRDEKHYLWEYRTNDSDTSYTPPHFYDYIMDEKARLATGGQPDKPATGIRRPYNPESYLLISTGPDQIWGMPPAGKTDDVTNFVRAQ